MNAQVLVAECMAVRPEYQRVSQQMLEADVAVMTNIRPDHFEEMGHSLDEIARSVCQMLPTGGVVFTTEKNVLPIIQEEAAKRRCTVFSVKTDPDDLPDVDFAENEALALSVCEWLGVERSCAIEGIRKRYCRDPFAQEECRMGKHRFVSAFSGERSGFDAKSTGTCPKRRKTADSGHESARGSTGKSQTMRAFCRAVCAG